MTTYWVVEPAVEVEPVVPAAKIAAEIVGDDEDGELDYNVQLYLRQLKLKDLQAKLKVACEAAQEYLERHEQLTDRFDRFYNAGAITCYRDDVEYLERAIPELEREIETLADLLYIPHDKMYEPDDTNPSVQAYLKKEALKSIDASEPATEVEDVAQTADSDFEEIEVMNPAVFDPAPSDKLLKIRGCIFTHSQYTWAEASEYLDKIEACDAGADHIQAGSNEWLIEEFSDDYTPSEYAVTFEGECLTSTLELIQAKVKSFDTPDRYSPHYAVLKYDAEPVEDDDEESEPPKQELPNDNGDFPCYDEPESPTELTEEIPAHIADKIAYCNKLLTTQTCRPKYFLDAMEDLQAMLDGNPAAIDAYNALVERYNEIVHAKGGDFLDCLSPIRADLDEMTTAEPTCDTSALPNYDEPEPATDSNTEQEETTLENENISTILHQVQHAEDVAKNTIREFFKVADSYSDNTPEDNDMAALYRMFAGEVYKIWREINKVRKTTGALLKNTTTATQAPDDTPPLCTTTAIPFTGLLSEQTWLYMSQSTFENYLAGKKWHAHIPEITAKDAAAALNILRQITPTEYHVTHTYHGEYGERQEYCKGDNGVDILKWYSPTYTNHPEHSDELMSIVFFRNDTPVAQIHIPARWLNDRLVFEGDRESLTAEQIAEVQEFLGLPPQEQVTEMPPLDSTALTKDLADTVLEVKIAADEIEEMLAGGYDLSDSGCASISKAQELLRQALAELGKLKSIDSAA